MNADAYARDDNPVETPRWASLKREAVGTPCAACASLPIALAESQRGGKPRPFAAGGF